MAGRPTEARDNRPPAGAPARGAGAFRERRLPAARHRGRSSGLGLRLSAVLGGPQARGRDGALSRASRGGAQLGRHGAIARSALVRSVPGSGCDPRRISARMAEPAAVRGAAGALAPFARLVQRRPGTGSGGSIWIFLAPGRLSAKTAVSGCWISLDFLGFPRP